jgi:hypothetical protein
MPYPGFFKAMSGIGRFAVKHPVAATGIAGTGIALARTKHLANNLESTLMREQMGYPGS